MLLLQLLSLLLLQLLLVLEETSGTSDEKVPLYLGGYLPMAGPSWNGGLGILPGIEVALDYVNNHTDLLPDHELRFIWNDTQVSQRHR